MTAPPARLPGVPTAGLAAGHPPVPPAADMASARGNLRAEVGQIGFEVVDGRIGRTNGRLGRGGCMPQVGREAPGATLARGLRRQSMPRGLGPAQGTIGQTIGQVTDRAIEDAPGHPPCPA